MVTLIIIVIAVLAVLLVAIFTKREYKQRFALNPIYDIHPEQVRELYMNMVSVSCVGDLHLDVELGAKAIDVKDMNMVNLLNYAFSNLDKSDKLSDNMEESVVKTVFSDLFYGKLDLTNIINNYQYGDYIYTLTDGVITREEKECISDIKYVSKLYGYSDNGQLLSVDVNMGYSKNGKLYDFADKELGNYDGNVENIGEMLDSSSFYRYYYVKDGDKYKLDSVEWLNRT